MTMSDPGTVQMTTDRAPSAPDIWYRAKLLALLAALIGHLYITFFVTPPAHLNGDEGVYHMMVDSFVKTGELTIGNGLEDLLSPELVPDATRLSDGRLAPQYPHLFIILAAPLYLALGIKAFYLINSFSYLGTIILTFLLAKSAFRDKNLALNASLILVFTTFFWEYSQAAWPHAISVFLALAAFYLCYLALEEKRSASPALLALLSGLLLGIGIGTRLDTVFIAPAIAILVVMAQERRLQTILLLLLGVAPALMLLTWTNEIKFGQLNPFTYGPRNSGSSDNLQTYWKLAGFGLLAIVSIWVITRSSMQAWIENNKRVSVSLFCLCCAAAVLIPSLRSFIFQLGDGFYTIVIDLRAMPVEHGGGREFFDRGPTGGIFTPVQGIKKSLLQSSPYLVLLILPLLAVFTRPRDRRSILVFLSAFLIFVLVFSYLKWHGGSSLNMRYLMPGLPFAAILVAYAWRDLTALLSKRDISMLPVIGILSLLGFSTLISGTWEEGMSELILLIFPLGLASVLLLLVIGLLVGSDRYRKRYARGAATLAVVSFVWAGTVAFIYDYPRTLALRKLNADVVALAKAHVEPDSLLFLPSFYPFSNYFDTERVRFAAPFFDGYASFRELALLNLASGRPVYFFNDSYFYDHAKKLDLLQGFMMRKLGGVRGRELYRLYLLK